MAEYNALCDCVPALRISAQANFIPLSGELLAARIISVEKERALRDRDVNIDERAADLVDLVLLKVQEDLKNFREFMNILYNDRDQYKTVIAKLESAYQSYRETPQAKPTPKLARNGMSCLSRVSNKIMGRGSFPLFSPTG